MKKIRILLMLLILVGMTSVSAQTQPKTLKSYVIGFYNLENLFDTIHQAGVNDYEYLPNGTMKWGTMKYTNKIHNMAYAISQFPKGLALMGVAEVENRGVLEDLVKQPSIANYHYRIVHTDSPDRRGVDVALLYNPRLFQVTGYKAFRLTIPNDTSFRTRDQLLVSGLLDGEEVFVLVNHWPSRSGGEERSRPKRDAAAALARSVCDSLFAINPATKIIVMGDLNDDPFNESLKDYLKAKLKADQVKPGELYNPMWELYNKGIGSLAYNDQWDLFDQIIVSYGWLGKDYSTWKFHKAEIFNRDFLKQKEGAYKGYPLRTHAGGVWQNGYSDHFPSMIYIVKEVTDK
jgi:hypothetical protein